MTSLNGRQRARRALVLGVGACATAVVVVATTSGCVMDRNRPRLTYVNNSTSTVLVKVELPGGDSTREREVPSGDATDLSLPECEDESDLRVTTLDGEVVGTIDGPICPGDTLTITNDMNLEYRDDG
jgi:hypothetical protein